VWQKATEPSPEISSAVERHRARAVAATLLLTIAIILIPLVQSLFERVVPPYLAQILLAAAICYVLSRTRYYRIGGMVAILVLCIAPTYALLIGYSDRYSFLLGTGRLMLLALLAAYVLYSLRASLVLALMIGAAFLFASPANQPNLQYVEMTTEFLLTTSAVFAIFAVARQYETTARKQVEAALSASEERYRGIVETQGELVSRWLPDTTLTFVNETYCRHFGKTRQELVGKSFREMMLPEEFDQAQSVIAALTKTQPTVTYQRRALKGNQQIVWVEWTDRAIFDENGMIREYQSVGHDITEQKLAQQALTESEERYRVIVESQTEMICRWTPDEKMTFVYEAFCRYFGKTREELIRISAFATVYPDDMPHVMEMSRKQTPQHPSVTYEHRVQIDSGEIRWHQWTDHAFFDSTGSIVEYQSVGRDITKLKMAEAAERKQREFAEALASTATLISSTLNLDEVLDRILDQAASLNAVNSAEIILLDGDNAYVARSRSNFQSADYSGMITKHFSLQNTRNLREMAATGRAVNIPDVRDYEGWLPSHAAEWIRSAVGAPIRLEGETIGFLSMNSHLPGVFSHDDEQHLEVFAAQAAIAIRNARLYDEVRRYANDLEAQVQQRTYELELAHQRQSAILNGTDEGIFYTEDGMIQFANVALGKLTGYSPEEFIGQTYPIFYAGKNADDVIDKLMLVRDAVKNEGVWRGEFPLRKKDGTTFEAGLTISLIGNRDSHPFRSVTVVRDISSEKALHLQRSNLVAYASHELRTPITNMKTRLYLLQRRPEDLANHVQILEEVTERMRHLVENLLDISRLEHGLIPLKRQEISLQDVVRAVVTHQQAEAERKGLRLFCEVPDAPVYVWADRERMIQVVTNLVTNGINYTPPSGQVSVRLRSTPGHAQIDVEDTGIGIGSDSLPYIFQPFYRVVSDVEGSGLGLSIAREIVSLHGGSLNAQSALKRGSTFTVTLPTRAKPEPGA
jgi:PAS domain S-box-containing protein